MSATAQNAQDAGRESNATTAAAQLASYAVKIDRLGKSLGQYPDFPKPGILFEDILPLFSDASLHQDLIDAYLLKIEEIWGTENRPDIIVGLDARGFLFGPTLALRLGIGFVPVRKEGKLPGKVETAKYEKEYGTDVFAMQAEAIPNGSKVLVVDDLIATGGSAAAAGTLVKNCGGQLMGYIFIIELTKLNGRSKLGDAPVYSLLESQAS